MANPAAKAKRRISTTDIRKGGALMHFEVKAVWAGNDVVAMSLEAADMLDAANQVQAQGYDVLSVRARQQWLKWLHPHGSRFSLLPKPALCRQKQNWPSDQ
jgi:hypothetical protein